MATTVAPAISNSIGRAAEYLPLLDEIYKAESKSAVLDTAQDRVRWSNDTHSFYLFETDMVGLGDYSRNGGFVRGDVTASWRQYTPQYDRARQFLVDRLDDSESMGMAFGTLASEFMRLKVIPETDAIRFRDYSKGAADSMKTAENISTGAGAVAAIDLGTQKLDDAEVPYEGRILFVNPNTYKFIKGGVTRMVMNRDDNVNYNVEMFNDMQVITVPSGRFNTAVTINAPTASNGAGGYTATGDAINYMIVHPSAVLQVVKHQIPRIFSPEVNQEADAWKFDYRVYHDCWVKAKKTNGIYVSHA